MHAPVERPRRSFWAATRRTVLIGGGAAAGLAVAWAAWPRQYKHNLGARPGFEVVNAWLRIGTDGRVVAVLPVAEIGQGATSGLAQILADELGADWRTVEVEAAPINPLYANTGLAADMLEQLPEALRGAGGWAAARAIRFAGVQLTGGSTAVRAYDRPLREAGAAARAMLCMAAARRWDMDWRRCDTADGFVTGGANRLRFAEIAAAAAAETPPGRLALRAVPEVGPARPRLDVPAKVDGSAVYGMDVRLPNMVYAAIKHGPVGEKNVPKLPELPKLPKLPGARESVLAVTSGPGWAAVVADRWYAAKQAAEALELSFPAGFTPADSAAMEAAVEAALDAGAPLAGEGRLVEARMRVPFAIHAALEPMNTTAQVVDNRAEIWAPTQSVWLVRAAVAAALGLPETAVTVHQTLAGGGFGRKAEADAPVQAALIARDVKRPVQLIWSREEDMRASPMRPLTGARYQARLGPDGAILSWHARIANQSVTQSFADRWGPALGFGAGSDPAKPPASDPASLEGAARLPYAVGKLEAEHAPLRFPVPVGFWRSVSNSYTGFFNEVFLDSLARTAGADPLAYRLKLLEASPRHRHLLATVADRAGYTPGMGVALHGSFGSLVAVVAEATLEPYPRVTRLSIGIDCGRAINPDLIRQQMEGSAIWALTAALKPAATFKDGYCQQANFGDYPLLTLEETPRIDVHILTNPAHPLGGVGEPGVPPVAPAAANAFAALLGKPLYALPLEIA